MLVSTGIIGMLYNYHMTMETEIQQQICKSLSHNTIRKITVMKLIFILKSENIIVVFLYSGKADFYPRLIFQCLYNCMVIYTLYSTLSNIFYCIMSYQW